MKTQSRRSSSARTKRASAHRSTRGSAIPPRKAGTSARAEERRGWPALKAGDRVALFSPSSHQGQALPEMVTRAHGILAGWGLHPDPVAPERRHLYLAGSDEERAAEFQRLYLDPDVRALFCMRGGYGSARMVPLLDPARLKAARPKPVIGFSDITAVFAWLDWACRVRTVHGPCLAAPGALTEPRAAESLTALRRLLFDPKTRPTYPVRLLHRPAEAVPVTGRLVGGCLSVLATTLGTPWAVDTRDAILFFEDTGEAPYRIDRLLTHLRTAGRFDHVRAVVFGYLKRCDSDPPGLLDQVLRDVFRDAPFPVATGMPAGHGDPNLPLILGAPARLDFNSADKTADARLITG